MFLAVATSLPELTIAISSSRAGLHEMVLGNIFGANMFNVVVMSVPSLVIAALYLAMSWWLYRLR